MEKRNDGFPNHQQTQKFLKSEKKSSKDKNASEKEYAVIDKITKSMMQKIIKVPVVQLRAACKRDQAEEMIDIISDLFDLEKENNKSKGKQD